MNAESTENPIAPAGQELQLVPAKVDLRTVKSQVTLACVLAVLGTFLIHHVLISHPLTTGDSAFLTEMHESISKGGIQNVLAQLPTWSATETGDGPLSTLVSAKTAWLGLTSARWEHGINLLIIALTALFVAQIACEISGRRGNRLAGSVPLWSAILFVCAPAQIQLMMRLADRAELLCAFFYAAAIFYYLRFRSTQRKLFLRLGLFATLLCVFTRPEAITLPLVITAAEVLLPSVTTENPNKRKPVPQRFIAVALFWLVLSFVATVGRLAPHLVPLLQAPALMTPNAVTAGWLSAVRIFLPLNPKPLFSMLIVGYVLAVCSAIYQLIAGRFQFSFGTLVFMLIWFLAASPTLYLDPSQVSASTAALACAPWAILLALTALPVLSTPSKWHVRNIAMLGATALTFLTAATYLSEQSQSTYQSEFIWPASYTFKGPFRPVYSFQLSAKNVTALQYEPPDAVRPAGTVFSTERSSIVPMKDGARIMPGQQRLRVWLPAPSAPIDNHAGAVAGIRLLYTSKTGCHTCHADSMKMIWQTENGNVGRASIIDLNFGQYLVWLSRYPQWSQARQIKRIGFEFEPGDYWVDVSRIDLIPYLMTSPALGIQVGDAFTEQSPGRFMPPREISPNAKPTIQFSVTQVPNAVGAKIVIDKATTDFQAEQEKDLYAFEPTHPAAAGPLMEGDFKSKEAGVYIPEKILKTPGQYQIRAVALNSEAAEIGLPTEPWVFEVR